MDDFKAAVEAFLLIIINIITIVLAADIYLKQKVFQTFRSVNRSYGNLRKQTFGFESIYSLTV